MAKLGLDPHLQGSGMYAHRGSRDQELTSGKEVLQTPALQA